MKKIWGLILLVSLIAVPLNITEAAGGIYASAPKSVVEGQVFSVTIQASGTTFNSFQGNISIGGVGQLVSISEGSAMWVKKPTIGGQFSGALTSAATSFTIATVRIKGTKPGTATVSVNSPWLANDGKTVSNSGGGASTTITRAPVVPGAVTVTSSTHPDQNTAYEATDIVLNWQKAGGVTGFSYLLDQNPESALGNTADSSNTTITYENQKVGVYYFHIKAQNADGWGPTTHFKIQIKEPDAKVESGIKKPTDIKIQKTKGFKNNIKDQTVSGIVITGVIPSKEVMEKAITETQTTEAEENLNESSTKDLYLANIAIEPPQLLPEGKILAAAPDKDGRFKMLIDWPFKPGSYKLTVQGQRDKLLTPVSDPISFEITQKNGGEIYLLSAKDEKKEIIPEKKWYEKHLEGIAVGSFFIIITILIQILLWIKDRRSTNREQKKKKTQFKWDQT